MRIRVWFASIFSVRCQTRPPPPTYMANPRTQRNAPPQPIDHDEDRVDPQHVAQLLAPARQARARSAARRARCRSRCSTTVSANVASAKTWNAPLITARFEVSVSTRAQMPIAKPNGLIDQRQAGHEVESGPDALPPAACPCPSAGGRGSGRSRRPSACAGSRLAIQVAGTSSTSGDSTMPSRAPLTHSRMPTSGSSIVSHGWKPPSSIRSRDPEEQPLAQHVERMPAVAPTCAGRTSRPTGCDRARETTPASVASRLPVMLVNCSDVVVAHPDRGDLPVVGRHHAVGVDVGQQRVRVRRARAGTAPRSAAGSFSAAAPRSPARRPRCHQYALRFRSQAAQTDLPRRVGGRRHRHHLEERELARESPGGRDRRRRRRRSGCR